jgi:hypothetical protein
MEENRRLLGWLPVDTIRKTFDATTQLAKELPLRYPLRRHRKARNPALNVQRRQEGFATDTLFSSEIALGGYTCAQLFCGLKSQYIQLFGMRRESEGPAALEDLVRDIGAPTFLRNDNSKMQTGLKWRDVLRKYCIGEQTTEPHHPQQNPAERRIQEVKKFSQKIMDRTGAPSFLWLFCMLYVVYLLNRTAQEQLNWRTPHEMALGETPDLSALLQFAFYEPVYYLDDDTSYPETKEKLGHFLGPAEHCGDELTFWILTSKKTVIARSVVRSALLTAEPNKREPKPPACREGSFTDDEIDPEGNKDDAQHEGRKVDDDDDKKPVATSNDDAKAETSNDGDGKENNLILELLSDLHPVKSLPVVDPMEIMGFEFIHENPDGLPVRSRVGNFDEETGLYKIIQGEDDEDWVTESVIQEALLSRQDDGAQRWIVDAIKAHRIEGQRVDVQVLWEDGNLTWEPMSLIRKSDPIKLAIYAKAKGLIYRPGWRWARKMLKSNKRFARTIKLLKGSVSTGPKFKFGIQVPRNIREAIRLDRENGNTLWQDAMREEIQQLLQFKTFRILAKGITTFEKMKDYTYVPLHFVFDVKFDLRRKARCVAGGNFTDPPDSDVFSGVVSIDNVRLGLFAAVHNDLRMCAADVGNAFLHGFTRELVYTRAGPEWGPDLEGCIMIVVRSIYGLKTSAARFHEVLSRSLMGLGFLPSRADADLWMKDCGTHYEYICTYVDDLLIMSRDPMALIKRLETEYPLKGVGLPEYYLGGDIKTYRKSDGRMGISVWRL